MQLFKMFISINIIKPFVNLICNITSIKNFKTENYKAQFRELDMYKDSHRNII